MTEYVSQDILSDNILKSFIPLLNLESIIATSRVALRHKFITPVTFGHKMYSIFFIIIISLLDMHAYYMYLYRFENYPIIYYLAFGAILLFYLLYICLMFNVRFLNGESNVEFYVKLQKIDRLMGIEKHDVFYNFVYQANCALVILSVMFLIAAFAIVISLGGVDVIGVIGTTYAQFSIFIELCHCGHWIYHFYIRLQFLNCIIRNYLEGNPKRPNPGDGIFPSEIRMLYAASMSHNFEWSSTDVYLKEILAGFASFRITYQIQVFALCARFIPLSLMGVYVMLSIKLLRNSQFSFEQYVYTPSIIYCDLIAIIVLCMAIEMFLKEMLKMKRLCNNVMALEHEGPSREKSKTILRIIKQQQPKFSVYGIWEMNAQFVLSVLGTFTTLNITMLQFMHL